MTRAHEYPQKCFSGLRCDKLEGQFICGVANRGNDALPLAIHRNGGGDMHLDNSTTISGYFDTSRSVRP